MEISLSLLSTKGKSMEKFAGSILLFGEQYLCRRPSFPPAWRKVYVRCAVESWCHHSLFQQAIYPLNNEVDKVGLGKRPVKILSQSPSVIKKLNNPGIAYLQNICPLEYLHAVIRFSVSAGGSSSDSRAPGLNLEVIKYWRRLFRGWDFLFPLLLGEKGTCLCFIDFVE